MACPAAPIPTLTRKLAQFTSPPLLCLSGEADVLPLGGVSWPGGEGDRLRSTVGGEENRWSLLSGHWGCAWRPGGGRRWISKRYTPFPPAREQPRPPLPCLLLTLWRGARARYQVALVLRDLAQSSALGAAQGPVTFLSHSREFGDTQLEVQGLVQGMHGGPAAREQTALVSWGGLRGVFCHPAWDLERQGCPICS